MKMEFDITKMVEEIAMQAKENQEEFIFQTIRPYCENILQIKINKEELKQILLNSIRKQQPCKDCISREAVDNYIVKLMSGYLYDEERTRLEDLTAYIWELPSVTPTRPNGKWKRISPAGIYECTNCNQVIMTSDIDCYKFCHGCGVRMEGKE